VTREDLIKRYRVPEGGWSSFFNRADVREAVSSALTRLETERETELIFPNPEDVFRAFNSCEPEQIKAIIVGQDPYHGPGQAHGLAFSVPAGTPLPPSLRNIFKALHRDLAITPPLFGDLTTWAQQGVFLLNRALTVPSGKPAGHQHWEWEWITQEALLWLAKQMPRAFLLWGSEAQKMESELEKTGPHLILKAPHPSPLSAYRGFYECRHFSQVNDWLRAHHKSEINWSL
jgi:uracil-DNA glycosylase